MRRFTIRQMMALIAGVGVACGVAVRFPGICGLGIFFVGPLIGAWWQKWRLGRPYPDAFVGAILGGAVQSAVIGFLIAINMHGSPATGAMLFTWAVLGMCILITSVLASCLISLALWYVRKWPSAPREEERDIEPL